MTTYPHSLLMITVASGAAWLMMRAGLAKNMLEAKRKRTTCASCRRIPCRCA